MSLSGTSGMPASYAGSFSEKCAEEPSPCWNVNLHFYKSIMSFEGIEESDLQNAKFALHIYETFRIPTVLQDGYHGCICLTL